MKIKIALLLICMTLSSALTGCGAPPAERRAIPDVNGQTISDITAPIENGADAPPDNETETQNPNEDELPQPDETENPDNGEQRKPDECTPQGQEQPEQKQLDTLLRCTANSLNVRRGAGTSYAALGTLDKGDMVMPVERLGDWYEILYMGGTAYVSASYLIEVEFDKASEKIERVITEGKKLLGIPYVYGAQRYHFGNGAVNPSYDGKSYDCSSLMQYIFKVGADVDLAMTSREQSLHGKEVSRDEIKRGDLLFFTNASRKEKTGLERIGHVALYLGDNIILHTASDHAVIEPISATRSSYFIAARRMIE